ncbi:MAG: acyl-CoA desaturase [Planctomycetes bacterium]|nr:acyl-CoA desaturase [Planctomycetota bacterium]
MRWFDTWAGDPAAEGGDPRRVDAVRVLPFAVMHLGCLLVVPAGWSPAALALAAGLYVLRMFAITAFYHRYFSHRTFRCSRAAQFAFALAGATAVQRGPLWWAAHHRVHHRVADRPGDRHSPRLDGFWWAHMGWITSRAHFRTDVREVPDLARYPELRFLDRFDMLVPAALAASLLGLGAWLGAAFPASGASGLQFLAWGFFVSTVVLFHGTCTINSLAHRMGSRRFETPDDSRNSLLLALVTLGEGWHNNHHRYPGSAAQGFRPREIDPTLWGLRLLERVGLVSDLHPVPARLREEAAR